MAASEDRAVLGFSGDSTLLGGSDLRPRESLYLEDGSKRLRNWHIYGLSRYKHTFCSRPPPRNGDLQISDVSEVFTAKRTGFCHKCVAVNYVQPRKCNLVKVLNFPVL